MTNLEEKLNYRDFYNDVTSGTKKVFVKRAKRKSTYRPLLGRRVSNLLPSTPRVVDYLATATVRKKIPNPLAVRDIFRIFAANTK